MIKKNMPSVAVVSIVYLLSDIDKERLVDVLKLLSSMNLKKADVLYLALSSFALFIAFIGCKEVLKSIIERIEVRREIMLKRFKKKLEKENKEKK